MGIKLEKENKELYSRLLKAYSDENLNILTAGIIGLYRSGEYDRLREISRLVSEYVDVYDEKVHRCFSKLIMTYHPDKSVAYLKEIEQLMNSDQPEKINNYAHILLIQDIESIVVPVNYKDIDYNPEYSWDSETRRPKTKFTNDQAGWIYDDEDYSAYEYETYYNPETERSFFSALKIGLYGTDEVDLPFYYLEEMEDIDLSGFEIEVLDGIEHCKYVRNLDLSGNKISDISQIVNLVNIEELYLQNNQIGLVDVLYNLRKLRILDISANEIDDISPLFLLPKLEYVNIMNNPVPRSQINMLRNNDILVIE
jgi:Leucine-rich repeat (LRR) protein